MIKKTFNFRMPSDKHKPIVSQVNVEFTEEQNRKFDEAVSFGNCSENIMVRDIISETYPTWEEFNQGSEKNFRSMSMEGKKLIVESLRN